MKQSRSKVARQASVVIRDKIVANVTVLGILALSSSILYLAIPTETSADEVTSSTAKDIYVPKIELTSSSENVASPIRNGFAEFGNADVVSSDSSLVESDDIEACFNDDSPEDLSILEQDVNTTIAEVEDISSIYVLAVPNWDYECDSNRKLYMDYTAVTDSTSAQYDLLYNNAYTTPEGLRAVGDRYCIALGSYYTTTIGQKVDLILANGSVIHCILGDCKADCHTNATNQYNWGTGNVAEFIIDSSVFSWQCDGSGTVNWINGLDGEIVNIVLVD